MDPSSPTALAGGEHRFFGAPAQVARQQAELLKVQSGQLRAQLEDQRKATAAQAEVLELQAADCQLPPPTTRYRASRHIRVRSPSKQHLQRPPARHQANSSFFASSGTGWGDHSGPPAPASPGRMDRCRRAPRRTIPRQPQR